MRRALSEQSYIVYAYFYSVTPNHIVDHTAQRVRGLLRSHGLGFGNCLFGFSFECRDAFFFLLFSPRLGVCDTIPE